MRLAAGGAPVAEKRRVIEQVNKVKTLPVVYSLTHNSISQVDIEAKVKNIVNILLFSFHSVYLTTSAKYMA
jgi:hypothetical protein